MEARASPEVSNEDEENSSLVLNEDFNTPERNSDITDTISYEDNEDTRSELKFDDSIESEGETQKQSKIQKVLIDNKLLEIWQQLAIDTYGLVNDDLRRKIWPLLLCVDPDPSEKSPLLSELSHHTEYSQVVLDVNRSLKRFPPGIPYNQRLALQDQLTVLILRVIMKYPHLRYYQGYHDVAITFLLVVGETVAFRIMERLSTDHLRECMEPTMEKTSYTLNYIYPIIQSEDKKLYEYMDRARVGTMFALPWYLTWFGHSLNHYRDVVRLYDFFLATPPLMPLYVSAALVMSRREEIFEVGCDMASIHCLLSHIPDDLDFEPILKRASLIYKKYPPKKLEKRVKDRIQREREQQQLDNIGSRRKIERKKPVWLRLRNCLPDWLFLHYKNKYGLLFAAATLLIGLYAYLKATESGFSLFKQGSWRI